MKAAVEEEIEEEQSEEEPLIRRGMGGRGESGGTKEDDPWVEKRIFEWVANLSLGEDEAAMLYLPQEEKEAAIREIEATSDPLERQTTENEKKLDWKLRLAREKKRRTKEANRVAREVESLQTCRQEVEAQPDIQAKLDKIIGSIELLGRAWTEHHQSVRAQDMALHSIQSGFREFARDVMTHVGTEVRKLNEGAEKFCAGAIEGAKVVVAAEMEVRPCKEPVKLKFPDSYGGKEEENFDNWEGSINTYVYLQHIVLEEQVLVAFHALKDDATSFVRSLARAADCEKNMVAYSKLTPLHKFIKLLRERFADVTQGVRAFDKLQTIHSRQWKSVRALKALMDDLVTILDQGVIETQLVNLLYHAMPEPLRGHFFEKTLQSTITYDTLSKEVVLFEAKSMPVPTFWHKDLDKGKKWKGRTISGQVWAKDHLILALDEGGTDEVPYSQIEWGLEEEDSSVGQARTYAAVAAGGRPQSRGGGQGQGGLAKGGRGPGAQGGGGQRNRQEGGRGQGPPPNRSGPSRSPQRRGGGSPQWRGGWHPGWPQGRAWGRSGLGPESVAAANGAGAVHLLRLLKKDAIWKWDKDCTSALKKLKRALIEYPVLKVADPSLPYVITTDASQYGIGDVLQQDDDNGYRPVEFMSARMPSKKVATSTYERELYALRQALEHLKHYLLWRHFKVYSDHETLTQAKMTPKLTRWASEIDQYDFELKPVKGKYNVVADALSRRSDYL
ncbi:hypothetical protein CBR_g53808 [Chara braunii]|uniref:Reverse transcriptase/retrotransposon-derived protein RNase H-like domain-containing protein n=1 Tax=Chara braunii TaxID=69332 RepID=A0A388K725_CHABU|nr:hypothetical protein CBR_g53808 [Chara braunii]|eukprot:GBG65836.1 hypothetical protein CBR_g53808 [Chara braunii]